MLAASRLELHFNPQRLTADLGLLDPGCWTPHVNRTDYDGMWEGIALRAPEGAQHPILQLAANPGQQHWMETEHLKRCHYFNDVLDCFQCELMSARLLKLNSGSVIKEHSDPELGYQFGEARLHIPIQTTDAIEFYVAGKRIDMRAGQVWYIDASQPHRVSNHSDTDRVHLVIDCRVNDWLKAKIEQGEIH
ncbi:aspartyl/asparaginyl beta-hydroxylase domain-containing protein [Aestuariibacter salexigens]|uniref:aspartyl/asparaginyl beta-hydroxylase domain-containing protein n=1 Tax=Aestuariibacter salexigens TaxID=226010 RepID=UPI0004158CF7|nr:aspartyl/asparaginyl beta-hydroxylase domain-containing protein [Aestuariibacter salexigens]